MKMIANGMKPPHDPLRPQYVKA